jgi:acyl-coenzyme A synthetase/AMP-(fatty) acid ligase
MADGAEASGGRLNASEYLLDRRLAAGDGEPVAFEYQAKPIGYAELAGRVAATAGALSASARCRCRCRPC